VGDQLLVQMAQRLSTLLRAGDTLSRQGGDEFVLLLPDCDEAGALELADNSSGNARRSLVVGAHEVTATLSIGIALFPRDGAGRSGAQRRHGTAHCVCKTICGWRWGASNWRWSISPRCA